MTAVDFVERAEIAHTCPTCGHHLSVRSGTHFDDAGRTIVSNGRVAKLTKAEMEMLILLRDNAPRSVSRNTIMSQLYQFSDDEPWEKILDVFVHRIRQKTKGMNFRIDTVWGEGYRFVPLPVIVKFAAAMAGRGF